MLSDTNHLVDKQGLHGHWKKESSHDDNFCLLSLAAPEVLINNDNLCRRSAAVLAALAGE